MRFERNNMTRVPVFLEAGQQFQSNDEVNIFIATHNLGVDVKPNESHKLRLLFYIRFWYSWWWCSNPNVIYIKGINTYKSIFHYTDIKLCSQHMKELWEVKDTL